MNIWLQYVSGFIVVLPILIGILYKIFFNKQLLSIFVLMVFSFVIETMNFICSLRGQNSMFLLDVYTPTEFILFILFYKKFFDAIKKSVVHYCMIFLFLCVAIFDTFFINDFLTVNNFSDSIESIVFILYSLLAFFFIMKKLMFPNLLNTSFFWINIAILIYFAGNLFLFLFSSHLQRNDQAQYLALYNIHSVTNILYYILISIGFWKAQVK
jgi:hypothetical protein